MRAFPSAAPTLLALLAACSSVVERRDCAASADCPAGEYCATTPDGNVCWPDAVPPVVSGVSVACQAPGPGGACLRDGVLRVQATVSDDAEVAGAEVALDVGGPPVPMARSGAVWAADVPLRRLPFEHFVHGVVATVTGRDGAGNAASVDASSVATVTRLRFARSLDSGIFSLGHPAVMQDGTVVTAGTNGKVYFVPWDGSGVSSAVAVGTGQITAAPLALGGSIWIGSEDNRVYEVTSPAGVWQPFLRTDDTGGRVLGSLALSADDRTLAATESGFVYAATSTGYKSGGVILPFSLGPVVDGDSIFAIASGALKRLTLVVGATSPDPSFSCAFGYAVSQPPALANGIVVVISNGADGLVRRCPQAGGDPEQIATTAIPSGGVAILSDGSIVVPEQTKTVSRWTGTGAPYAGWEKPDLGGATRTPLVLASPASLLVPTAKGVLHALREDGTIAWSGQLSTGTASLQPGNIYTPPGQPAGETLSTAFFAGSDGVLHAVIVDGKLDAAAPWPKAFHDPRNTNRAGSQP